MRLSETHPSFHRVQRSDHRSFSARHAAMLALLLGVAVLLRADTALPVTARIPGILILLGVLAYLLVGHFKTRSERRR